MALLAIVVGLTLTSVNIIGRFKGPLAEPVPKGRSPVYGYDRRRFSPGLARRKYRHLKRSGLSAAERAEMLYHLISGSIVHRKYRLSFFDNWLLKSVGLFYPPLLATQDADLLWRRGAGKCDQVSMLYAAKAGELGLQCSILGLDGHLLAEVATDSEAFVVDSDMGRLWKSDFDEVQRSAEGLVEGYLARGFPLPAAELTARIIRCTRQPKRVRYPHSARLYRVEKAAQFLSWLLPLASIAVGTAYA